MLRLRKAILLLGFVTASFCLICETCDGEACADADRWVQENCSPSTKYCYRFVNQEHVFRRGCSATNCTSMPGIPVGTQCNTCDSDRCNGLKPINVYGPGGGDAWNSVSSLNTLVSLFIFGSLRYVF